MTRLSKRLEQIVKKELSKNVIPIKTKEGILVGDVLIVTQNNIKHLYKEGDLVYSEIHLNSVAIKIANILAFRKSSVYADKLYKLDQEYGKWFVDSQMLRSQYQKSLNSKDYDRADMLWARYCESRDRTMQAKLRTESLLRIE
jgi:hypothetical protein